MAQSVDRAPRDYFVRAWNLPARTRDSQCPAAGATARHLLDHAWRRAAVYRRRTRRPARLGVDASQRYSQHRDWRHHRRRAWYFAARAHDRPGRMARGLRRGPGRKRHSSPLDRPRSGSPPNAALRALVLQLEPVPPVTLAWMLRPPISLPLIWIIIGVIVAATHNFFDHIGTIGAILSAILAVLLWPLILLGVKITIAI